MSGLDQLAQNLLVEAVQDEVGLWSIIWHLRREFGMTDADQIRRTTLQLVRVLLETGRVVIGYYAPSSGGPVSGRIQPWHGSVDELIQRINEEWDRLGREPNIAEIALLQAKD